MKKRDYRSSSSSSSSSIGGFGATVVRRKIYRRLDFGFAHGGQGGGGGADIVPQDVNYLILAFVSPSAITSEFYRDITKMFNPCSIPWLVCYITLKLGFPQNIDLDL